MDKIAIGSGTGIVSIAAFDLHYFKQGDAVEIKRQEAKAGPFAGRVAVQVRTALITEVTDLTMRAAYVDAVGDIEYMEVTAKDVAEQQTTITKLIKGDK